MDTLVVVAVGLMAMKLVWYTRLIAKNKISPVLATYIVGMAGQNISAWSYYATGKPWRDALVVYVAAAEVTLVSVYLVISLWRRNGGADIVFNRVQRYVLLCMVGIVLYWYFNRNAFVTFIATQVLMVLAYIPTLTKAVELKKAFDSPVNWGLLTMASVVAGTIPFFTGNSLGQLAAVRSFLLSGVTVFVLLYYDKRNNYERWRDEEVMLSRIYRKSRG